MQWVAENWVVLLLVGGMLAMHLLGHGHGHSHGGDGTKKPKENSNVDDLTESDRDGER